ncbi:MAG: ABC transporter permease [Clostridia bacterium]|nr:ABC transporter permease [Clostridia bacterium]
MAGKSGRSIAYTPERSILKRILSWEGALVIIFIGVLVMGRIMSASFTPENVLREMPKYLSEILIALPMGFILIMGEIDISVGSIVCLSATVATFAGNAGIPFPVVILICLATGLACGALNGFILTRWPELPPMIVTLGTQIIFRGIEEVSLGAGGSASYVNSKDLDILGARLGPFPVAFFAVIIAAVIYIVVLSKTTFGRKLYAIGSNRTAANYAGIKVGKVRFIVYTLAGLMSAICALFILTTTYGANTTTGQNYEMDVIAMCVFGGIATTGGKGNLFGALIAGFTIVCLRIALGLNNINTQLILVIIGLLLIVSVLISSLTQSDFFKKRQLKKAAEKRAKKEAEALNKPLE